MRISVGKERREISNKAPLELCNYCAAEAVCGPGAAQEIFCSAFMEMVTDAVPHVAKASSIFLVDAK